MILKACLFDLDGVIVDTARYHYIAWKHIARELGFDFTEKDNERLKGVSRMQSLEILLEIGGIKPSNEEKELLATRKNEMYVSYISELTPADLLPGAEKLLVELRQNSIYTALGSASKNAPAILNGLHIAHLFDVVIDGNRVSKAKPDPEVFLLGASELGVNPTECVVFEDAEAGVEAALAGGMKCIGIGDAGILKKANMVVLGLHKVNLQTIKKLFS